METKKKDINFPIKETQHLIMTESCVVQSFRSIPLKRDQLKCRTFLKLTG